MYIFIETSCFITKWKDNLPVYELEIILHFRISLPPKYHKCLIVLPRAHLWWNIKMVLTAAFWVT